MAFYPLLSLVFVSSVHFVAYVNCLRNIQPTGINRLQDIDVNSKKIQELVKDIPKRFNEFGGREIVKVINAQGQVVSGYKYILTVHTRSKNSQSLPTKRCTLTILDQPWLKSRILHEVSCLFIKRLQRMPMPGGWMKARITRVVRRAAAYGMSIINSKCNCFFMKLVSNIKRVHKKISSGLMYKMQVTIMDTICQNTAANYGKNFLSCPRNPRGHPKDCEMTVLKQPWKTPMFKLISTTCQ